MVLRNGGFCILVKLFIFIKCVDLDMFKKSGKNKPGVYLVRQSSMDLVSFDEANHVNLTYIRARIAFISARIPNLIFVSIMCCWF